MKKFLFFVAIVLAFSSCQQRQKRVEPEATRQSERVDTVEVDTAAIDVDAVETDADAVSARDKSSDYGDARISQECFGAKDGFFDDLNKFCNRKDEAAVREGIVNGVFTVLQPGACSIVDTGFGKKKVRVNGEEWWVASEFVD